MRLVDISFKDINGQASDIKGNLNNIGHIAIICHDHIDRDPNAIIKGYSGYFEIDGSTIINAYDNYYRLFIMLGSSNTSSDMLAKRSGNNIVLNSKPALISVKAAAGGFSGIYAAPQTQTHTHNYWQGEQVYEPTSSTLTQKDPAQYSMRFFIYHGVH